MKRKKKQSKTVEELLQEALVPAEEQPYLVPENWVWVRLESICQYIQRGKSPKYADYSSVKVISQKCVQWKGFDLSKARYIQEETKSKYQKVRFLQFNDILWNSTGTGTLGRVSILDKKLEDQMVADSHVTVVRVDQKKSESKFVFLWLSSPYVQSLLERSFTGSTNQVELSLKSVKSTTVPLPPLHEQKRIVERVESLLTKIDQAKKLIEEVKASWETRRMAILDQAFRGQLGTNDPSEECVLAELDGISEKDLIPEEEQPYPAPRNWVWVRLGEVVEFAYGKSLTKKRRTGSGYPVYGSNGIVGYHKEYLIKGPLIIVGRKGSHGKVNWSKGPCWPIDTTYYIKSRKLELNYRWLYYLLRTLKLETLNRSSAIPGLNREDAYLKIVTIPPLAEQKRIVQKVESLLNRLDQERELTDHLEKQLDTLKQSILDRAFRGELGTQDSTDEHALERLKRSLQSQIAD